MPCHEKFGKQKGLFLNTRPAITLSEINLICPSHKTILDLETGHKTSLLCADGCRYEVIKNIPRFVPSDLYSSSFGLQWNAFRKTQLDSYSGMNISQARLARLVGGSLEGVRGKTILEAGCGAGRFTEVLLKAGANVFALDLSSAVEANLENVDSLDNGTNYFICQADISNLPLSPGLFDMVICIGVIQHTPCPEDTIAALCRQVRPGGQLVIDHYTYGYQATEPRQLLRKLLLQVPPESALEFCREMTELLWPIHRTFWENRNDPQIANFRDAFLAMSPVVDHQYDLPELGEQLKIWSMLDTHDTLTDVYKHLRSTNDIFQCLANCGMSDIEAVYAGNGVEARAIKT